MEKTTLDILSRPFERSEIKQRPGYNRKVLDYVEAHTVIARLNEAFDGDWSFEIAEHSIVDNEVVILGRLTAGDVSKGQFGGKPRTSGSQLGDDLKAAASDCLKKCATLLGVGLHLYRDEVVPGDNGDNGKPEEMDAKGFVQSLRERRENDGNEERLTEAQKLLRERRAAVAK